MALLEVEDLKVYYPVKSGLFSPKRYLKAVDGVSFSLNEGETLSLVGESGCGKSTLGRALVQLEKPFSGRILIDGKDLRSLRGKALREARRDFQMIFQDPYGSLNPRLSIFSTLDEVLSLRYKEPERKRRSRAETLLEEVGFNPSFLDRYPHEFSGGQRQRIGIARALAAEPRFIVADEPVSALDVSVQASIINLLADIQKRTGTAFLFIAHDLAVVEHISQRIMVMYLGHIVESGPASELVQYPFHPYTQALVSAVPQIDQNGNKRIILNGDVPSPLEPPQGCPFHPRCIFAQQECRENNPVLNALTANANRQCACFKIK
ncbi:MAG: dipeptide ABC transporter ATP-binding protein [Lentisphaeria bacterium]|nr:dipeptide ABC transporter ATP-binding protein [Lentisphaeria bacterium]